MRISDWSSDVCSSDLITAAPRLQTSPAGPLAGPRRAFDKTLCAASCPISNLHRAMRPLHGLLSPEFPRQTPPATAVEIGRASCRERVCQYVYISVVSVSLKKK